MKCPTKPTIVGIAGSANIRNIAEIHQELRHALQRNKAVELRLNGDPEVDLTFVQLVEVARRFAANAGKTVTLSVPAAAGMREILQRGGFLASGADQAFWLHQTGAG